MIRIATVYLEDPKIKISSMDTIRWLKISEALARLGFKVDVITNDRQFIVGGTNLRGVSYGEVRWEEYDIIKTLFHKGFQALINNKADNYSFIISKFGSVVGRTEHTKGVYFYKDVRKELQRIQEEIAQKSRYVTILTEQSKRLWLRQFSRRDNVLLVPTGVDRDIPLPGKNPYREFKEKIAVYTGNVYLWTEQKKANLTWQRKLNTLGRLLRKKKIRLCLVGTGNTEKIDPEAVTFLGSVDCDKIWDYQYFADVGIVLAQGNCQHNESSKIYYYLRTGLPVVSEEPVPNNNIIREAELGFIARYNDHKTMADMIEEAVYKKWERGVAIDYTVKHHTWDDRARMYYRLIEKEFPDKIQDLPGSI